MNILSRFARIKDEFGMVTFIRTLLLLVGSVGMAILGYLGLDTLIPALIVVVGLLLGWIVRRQTVGYFEYLSWALPASLFAYGIVMFVGEKALGMSRELQLIVLTSVTVILFGIQFWTLSDPQIVNNEDA